LEQIKKEKSELEKLKQTDGASSRSTDPTYFFSSVFMSSIASSVCKYIVVNIGEFFTGEITRFWANFVVHMLI
jgi:hypothetical protein